MSGFRATILLTLICIAGTLHAEEPAAARLKATYTAKELIDGYEQALRPFERVTYVTEGRSLIHVNGTARLHSESGVREDEDGRGVYRHLYRRDGARVDILSLKDGVKPGPDAWGNPKLHRSRVIVDDAATIVDYYNVTDRLTDAVVARRTPKNFSPADSLRMTVAGFAGVGALDGCLSGRRDKSLPQILRDAADLRVRQEPEVIDGHATFVLECTDQDAGYSYTVCIDPAAGFHPRRIVQKRLQPEMDGSDVTVDKVEIKKVGDTFVPIAAHYALTYRAGPSYLFTLEQQCTRAEVDFHPDFEKLLAFKMLAPPGIHARNEDDSTGRHRWKFENGEFILTNSGAVGGVP